MRKRQHKNRVITDRSYKSYVRAMVSRWANMKRRDGEIYLWAKVIEMMVIDALAYHETKYSQGDLALERELAYQMIDRLHPCYIGMCDAAGFSPTEIRGMVMKAREL